VSTSVPPPVHETVPLRDRAGLGTAEASVYIGLSVPTVKKYRLTGTGPRYARIGSKIVYRSADLDEYIARRLTGGDH
jgi:predicted DNA-binding transcriptional regulator AlpA